MDTLCNVTQHVYALVQKPRCQTNCPGSFSSSWSSVSYILQSRCSSFHFNFGGIVGYFSFTFCLITLGMWYKVFCVGSDNFGNPFRAATASKADKVWSLPRFWVSIRSYNEQPVKKNCGRILNLAWLKFAVAVLIFHQW